MKLSFPSYTFDFGNGISSQTGQATRNMSVPNSTCELRTFSYRFDDRRFVEALSALLPRSDGIALLPSEIADGLDIAVAVYVSDRYAPRSFNNSSQWHREMHVRIPVRQDRLLESDEARTALEKFLSHLTDDHWSIEFVHRTNEPRTTESTMSLFRLVGGTPTIALHSGGLDSFIGIVEAAQNSSRNPVVAVAVATHSHTESLQQDVVSMLRNAVDTEFDPATLEVGLSGISRNDQESSQ